MKPHVVVIGGGFGGMSAARKLAHTDVNITLIDRSNHHLFQPLLYQVATAGLSPADIAAPIRSILRHQINTAVLMAEVTGIDPKENRVLLNDRTIQYDYLVVATGSWYSYFNHDEWNQYAPGLKSIVDATRIRRRILLALEAAEMESDPETKKALLSFVLVGAGPTGVEMAGSIAELVQQALKTDFRHIDPTLTRITLIEAGSRILAAFPESLARSAQKRLESFGIEIITNTRVSQIDQDGVVLSGQRIRAKNTIWCAGVVGSPAGQWLQVETDRVGRVKVDANLSVPNYPNIFVVGDTSSFIQDGKPLPGVAPVAMQQGKYVGKLIHNKVQGNPPLPPFRYINKGNLATVGRSFAICDFGWLKLSGLIAWIVWTLVHIYYLIGFRNRLLVMIQWAWAYFSFQRGARLITLEKGSE